MFSDILAIRGWDENLLHAVDSATENVENMDQATSSTYS